MGDQLRGQSREMVARLAADKKESFYAAGTFVDFGEIGDELTRQQALAASKVTHWREDHVGIVLSMQSEVHRSEENFEFQWIVMAEIHRLTFVVADMWSVAPFNKTCDSISSHRNGLP